MSDILFFYISSHSGHQHAAEAVQQALRQRHPEISTAGVDTVGYAYPTMGRLVSRMYLEILKHTPQIWDFLYDNPTVLQATREVRELLSVLSSRKLLRLLDTHKPKALVCTQAMPAAALAALKMRGKIHQPLIGVVTDFDVHHYWLSPGVDFYMVATDETKDKMVRHGVDPQRVQVTGIPVHPAFVNRGDAHLERIRLGLYPRRPTVLVMGGSHGLGPLEKIVATLRQCQPSLQVLCVCGHNTDAQTALRAQFGNDCLVRVFGFVRNISRLMDASDMVVSKPGGLTSAEALAKGVPLIMIRPIPGQEERNAAYLLKNNAAERVESIEELGRTVQALLQNPARLQELQNNALFLRRPHAAFDVAEIVLSFLKTPAPNGNAVVAV